MTTEQAFTAIYDSTFPDLRRFVVSRSACVADVADIPQSTYLKLYRQLQKGAAIRDPKAYLLTTARHELGRQYKHAAKSRQNIPVFSAGEEESFEALELDFLNEEIDEDHLLAEAVWSEIRAADFLTVQIFTLYFLYDTPLNTIAAQLDVPESTVKNRLYRTLKKLRQQFYW